MRLALRRLRGAPPLAATMLRGLLVGLCHKVCQQHHLGAAAGPAQGQEVLGSNHYFAYCTEAHSSSQPMRDRPAFCSLQPAADRTAYAPMTCKVRLAVLKAPGTCCMLLCKVRTKRRLAFSSGDACCQTCPWSFPGCHSPRTSPCPSPALAVPWQPPCSPSGTPSPPASGPSKLTSPAGRTEASKLDPWQHYNLRHEPLLP